MNPYRDQEPQGLEGLAKYYRDKAERLEKLLKWQGDIHVEKVACIHALDDENQQLKIDKHTLTRTYNQLFDAYQRLQADLEQTQEKLASQEAGKFWGDILDGIEQPKAQQIQNELTDYYFLMEQVSLVYSHVTGGLLSKPNYEASVVIGCADDATTKLFNEQLDEHVEPLHAQIQVLEEKMGHPASGKGGDRERECAVAEKSHRHLEGH